MTDKPTDKPHFEPGDKVRIVIDATVTAVDGGRWGCLRFAFDSGFPNPYEGFIYTGSDAVTVNRLDSTDVRTADKNACGTCRTRTANGKPVEHEECAARAQLIEAPDAPGYDVLTDLTLEQKAALPARFHVPVFDDLGSPKAWLCAVCWEEGVATQWPCATAYEQGAEVFTR